MTDETTSDTRAIPTLMLDVLASTEKDLNAAGLELNAAKEQHKEAKVHFDECQVQFNLASRAILNVEKKDGFPPDSPLADAVEPEADPDTPPADEDDEWEV